MNIGASLSSTFADMTSPMPAPVAGDSGEGAAAVSASSSTLMNVASEAIEEDISALGSGSVNTWA